MLRGFSSRHIGIQKSDLPVMLQTVGAKSLEDLIDRAVPSSIRTKGGLDLPPALSEQQNLDKLKSYAKRNKVFKSLIGTGYYGTITPGVILRNILENPGWYTAYTPYQAEISQGRMEALLNFQTMIMELTGMELANASLLDEGTAAAEAMAMAFHAQKKTVRSKLLIDERLFPQTKEILGTRAEPLNIQVQVAKRKSVTANDETICSGLLSEMDNNTFAIVVQYPDSFGQIIDYKNLAEKAHANGTMVIAVSDLLSLSLLTPPGEWGADIAVGSAQRFGVPMGFGGPHAGYMATKTQFSRSMPGRIIGVSKDTHGNPALRLALQTREQHIRREKATSNICTAQVLLAVIASMYAVYHGPEGIKNIAKKVNYLATQLSGALKKLGVSIVSDSFFDTVAVQLKSAADADRLMAEFRRDEMNIARLSETVCGLSLDETTTANDLEKIVDVFARASVSSATGTASNATPNSAAHAQAKATLETAERAENAALNWAGKFPSALQRKSEFLTHPVFHKYHSETEMLRYIHRLEVKDLSLNQSMIPLGSCTMKLNATTEMIPVTWPEFSNMHPFVPDDQADGYHQIVRDLENWLSQITGFAGISLQPNAGSQGEYAGLLVIRAYHKSRGQGHRNICLIPTSAHGTNPASAVMAGLNVVPVACDTEGNIDFSDLKNKIAEHKDNLSTLMLTYPSTHGVFEEGVSQICQEVHSAGGQVYMDGANFNALVGVARPGDFGPDVCHLNLHKTFCIPHGGGGPGIGPIGVAKHLVGFLPKHSLVPSCGPQTGIAAVAAAPWGSASILPISWSYIAMMGADGLRAATDAAILNANYIAKKLSQHFPILYKGKNGLVAHECIIDTRGLKTSADVTVDDIAKRLMDYGFHAPTMSWPVAGTLMIEPTESESKEELDRFCDALIQIREEAREIELGQADRVNNVLKNAPHTVAHVTSDKWEHPYTREKAAFPLQWVRERKFWPSVGRVDNVYGDRNLVCACPPMSEYAN